MSSQPPTDSVQRVSRLNCYQLDPTTDARWAELVETHSRASVFHTVGWLKALQLTYGYVPMAFTTSSPTAELKDGLLFCQVNSWLTGKRLVSLPFSDHCDPLCQSAENMDALLRHSQAVLQPRGCKSAEIRPIAEDLGESAAAMGFGPAGDYFLHIIDLRPNLDNIARTFDKDSIQRRIQRAEKAGLVEKCGASEQLLKAFYGLFVSTRRRHHVPPPPYAWFQNLIRSLGRALEIRVAYKEESPIAAILTLRFRKTGYFKYGCSDERFNKFGATPWLLWRAIVAAKSDGALEFDMGRTEGDNAGLLAFKNHWVPHPRRLVYWKFPATSSFYSVNNWKSRAAKSIFSHMPNRLLTIAGSLIYRHIG